MAALYATHEGEDPRPDQAAADDGLPGQSWISSRTPTREPEQGQLIDGQQEKQ